MEVVKLNIFFKKLKNKYTELNNEVEAWTCVLNFKLNGILFIFLPFLSIVLINHVSLLALMQTGNEYYQLSQPAAWGHHYQSLRVYSYWTAHTATFPAANSVVVTSTLAKRIEKSSIALYNVNAINCHSIIKHHICILNFNIRNKIIL